MSKIAIVDLSNGQIVEEFDKMTSGMPIKTSYSVQNGILLCALKNNIIQAWDLEKQELIGSFAGHSNKITEMQFLTDSLEFVSISHDGTAKHWDLKSGSRPLKAINAYKNEAELFKAHQKTCLSLVFSADSQEVLTTFALVKALPEKYETRVWRLSDGCFIRSIPTIKSEVPVGISPDGKILISGQSRNVYAWDTKSGEKIRSVILTVPERRFLAECTAIAFIPDSHKAIVGIRRIYNDRHTGLGGSDLDFWDIDDATSQYPRMLAGADKGALRSIVLSSDGRNCYTASEAGFLKKWNFEALLRKISFQPGSNAKEMLVEFTYEGHTAAINTIAVSEDNKIAYTGSDDLTIRKWDLIENELLATFTGHRNSVVSTLLSPDEDRIISASLDGSIRVWDTKSGENKIVFWDRNPLVNMQLSPDKRYLVAGNSVGQVWIFDPIF